MLSFKKTLWILLAALALSNIKAGPNKHSEPVYYSNKYSSARNVIDHRNDVGTGKRERSAGGENARHWNVPDDADAVHAAGRHAQSLLDGFTYIRHTYVDRHDSESAPKVKAKIRYKRQIEETLETTSTCNRTAENPFMPYLVSLRLSGNLSHNKVLTDRTFKLEIQEHMTMVLEAAYNMTDHQHSEDIDIMKVGRLSGKYFGKLPDDVVHHNQIEIWIYLIDREEDDLIRLNKRYIGSSAEKYVDVVFMALIEGHLQSAKQLQRALGTITLDDIENLLGHSIVHIVNYQESLAGDEAGSLLVDLNFSNPFFSTKSVCCNITVVAGIVIFLTTLTTILYFLATRNRRGFTKHRARSAISMSAIEDKNRLSKENGELKRQLKACRRGEKGELGDTTSDTSVERALMQMTESQREKRYSKSVDVYYGPPPPGTGQPGALIKYDSKQVRASTAGLASADRLGSDSFYTNEGGSRTRGDVDTVDIGVFRQKTARLKANKEGVVKSTQTGSELKTLREYEREIEDLRRSLIAAEKYIIKIKGVDGLAMSRKISGMDVHGYRTRIENRMSHYSIQEDGDDEEYQIAQTGRRHDIYNRAAERNGYEEYDLNDTATSRRARRAIADPRRSSREEQRAQSDPRYVNYEPHSGEEVYLHYARERAHAAGLDETQSVRYEAMSRKSDDIKNRRARSLSMTLGKINVHPSEVPIESTKTKLEGPLLSDYHTPGSHSTAYQTARVKPAASHIDSPERRKFQGVSPQRIHSQVREEVYANRADTRRGAVYDQREGVRHEGSDQGRGRQQQLDRYDSPERSPQRNPEYYNKTQAQPRNSKTEQGIKSGSEYYDRPQHGKQDQLDDRRMVDQSGIQSQQRETQYGHDRMAEREYFAQRDGSPAQTSHLQSDERQLHGARKPVGLVTRAEEPGPGLNISEASSADQNYSTPRTTGNPQAEQKTARDDYQRSPQQQPAAHEMVEVTNASQNWPINIQRVNQVQEAKPTQRQDQSQLRNVQNVNQTRPATFTSKAEQSVPSSQRENTYSINQSAQQSHNKQSAQQSQEASSTLTETKSVVHQEISHTQYTVRNQVTNQTQQQKSTINPARPEQAPTKPQEVARVEMRKVDQTTFQQQQQINQRNVETRRVEQTTTSTPQQILQSKSPAPTRQPPSSQANANQAQTQHGRQMGPVQVARPQPNPQKTGVRDTTIQDQKQPGNDMKAHIAAVIAEQKEMASTREQIITSQFSSRNSRHRAVVAEEIPELGSLLTLQEDTMLKSEISRTWDTSVLKGKARFRAVARKVMNATTAGRNMKQAANLILAALDPLLKTTGYVIMNEKVKSVPPKRGPTEWLGDYRSEKYRNEVKRIYSSQGYRSHIKGEAILKQFMKGHRPYTISQKVGVSQKDIMTTVIHRYMLKGDIDIDHVLKFIGGTRNALRRIKMHVELFNVGTVSMIQAAMQGQFVNSYVIQFALAVMYRGTI